MNLKNLPEKERRLLGALVYIVVFLITGGICYAICSVTELGKEIVPYYLAFFIFFFIGVTISASNSDIREAGFWSLIIGVITVTPEIFSNPELLQWGIFGIGFMLTTGFLGWLSQEAMKKILNI